MCRSGGPQSQDGIGYTFPGSLEPGRPGHLAIQSGKAIRSAGAGHLYPVVSIELQSPNIIPVHPQGIAKDRSVMVVAGIIDSRFACAFIKLPPADKIGVVGHFYEG